MSTQSLTPSALASASKRRRWMVLLLVATVMMMGYVFWDVVSPISTSLRMPVSQGGMGWTQAEYGFYAGSYSFFNVCLLMLFFGGVILDKCGIRFAGLLSTGAMALGAAINFYAVSFISPAHMVEMGFTLFGLIPQHIKLQVIVAAMGFGLFGVGCDITGITVSKVITKWFTGHELASAMGLQVAMARLGTASALSFSPLIAQHWGIASPLVVGVALLVVGFLLFVGYCFIDKKAGSQDEKTSDEPNLTASNETPLEAEVKGEAERFRFRDILVVLRNPGFWLIALLCVLFYSSIRPFMKFATDLLVSKYGVAETTAGWIVAVIPYGSIVLTPLFGSLYDRLGRGISLMLTGCAVLSVCHLALALPGISQTSFALVIMVFIGISFSLVPSALWPSVPKIVPMKMLGSAYSIIYFIQNIGLALVPMLIGRANDADPSYTTSMSLFCGFGFAAVVVALALYAVDKKMAFGLEKANIVKVKK